MNVDMLRLHLKQVGLTVMLWFARRRQLHDLRTYRRRRAAVSQDALHAVELELAQLLSDGGDGSAGFLNANPLSNLLGAKCFEQDARRAYLPANGAVFAAGVVSAVQAGRRVRTDKVSFGLLGGSAFDQIDGKADCHLDVGDALLAERCLS